MRRALTAAVLLAAIAATPALATASPGDPPQIRQVEYSEDYEQIGHHYNVSATIKGQAEDVSARFAGKRSDGKLSNVVDTRPRGKVWHFRDKGFVKALRVELETEGKATVAVRAASGAGVVRARCKLVFEPDPMFGDYAGGTCKRR